MLLTLSLDVCKDRSQDWKYRRLLRDSGDGFVGGLAVVDGVGLVVSSFLY